MHTPSPADPSVTLGQIIAARRILAHLETEGTDIPEDQYCVVMMWLTAWAGGIERALAALRRGADPDGIAVLTGTAA